MLRFGTSTGDGGFGSIAAKPLLLRMTASIFTSGTTKLAVILGQQVRAPLMVASLALWFVSHLRADDEVVADIWMYVHCTGGFEADELCHRPV